MDDFINSYLTSEPRNESAFAEESDLERAAHYINGSLKIYHISPLNFCNPDGKDCTKIVNAFYSILERMGNSEERVKDLESKLARSKSNFDTVKQKHDVIAGKLQTSRSQISEKDHAIRNLERDMKSTNSSVHRENKNLQKSINELTFQCKKYNKELKRKEIETNRLKERIQRMNDNYLDIDFDYRPISKRLPDPQSNQLYQTLISSHKNRFDDLVNQTEVLSTSLGIVIEQMNGLVAAFPHVLCQYVDTSRLPVEFIGNTFTNLINDLERVEKEITELPSPSYLLSQLNGEDVHKQFLYRHIEILRERVEESEKLLDMQKLQFSKQIEVFGAQRQQDIVTDDIVAAKMEELQILRNELEGREKSMQERERSFEIERQMYMSTMDSLTPNRTPGRPLRSVFDGLNSPTDSPMRFDSPLTAKIKR
ncbi:hypothetical protein PCE1_003142 [Barthelona sp. PCE]